MLVSKLNQFPSLCLRFFWRVSGCAETGSGKTAAFAIPLIQYCMRQPPIRRGDGPLALVRQLGWTDKFLTPMGCPKNADLYRLNMMRNWLALCCISTKDDPLHAVQSKRRGPDEASPAPLRRDSDSTRDSSLITRASPLRGLQVMAPTRELAQQIEKEVKAFSRSSKNFKAAIVVGGANMGDQVCQ